MSAIDPTADGGLDVAITRNGITFVLGVVPLGARAEPPVLEHHPRDLLRARAARRHPDPRRRTAGDHGRPAATPRPFVAVVRDTAEPTMSAPRHTLRHHGRELLVQVDDDDVVFGDTEARSVPFGSIRAVHIARIKTLETCELSIDDGTKRMIAIRRCYSLVAPAWPTASVSPRKRSG